MALHECNDETTCKSGMICCSNESDKGRCIEPESEEQMANLGKLIVVICF